VRNLTGYPGAVVGVAAVLMAVYAWLLGPLAWPFVAVGVALWLAAPPFAVLATLLALLVVVGVAVALRRADGRERLGRLLRAELWGALRDGADVVSRWQQAALTAVAAALALGTLAYGVLRLYTKS
jgi:uncharacterized membrane protein